MAMEMGRSFAAGCTPRPPVVRAPSASARGAPPYLSLPSLGCSSSSLPFPVSQGNDGHAMTPSAYSCVLIKKSRSFSCFAVEGKSTATSNSTTADTLPSPDAEQSQPESTESSTGIEEQESIGKALSQMRKERVATGEENPSKTEEFWRGVLEETRLIEWPSLQKVLGTTGVVTSIIVGSSLVLLTVNAILAQLSDAFFKNVPPA